VEDKRRFNDAGDCVVADPVRDVYDIESLHGWVLIRKLENTERMVDGVVRVATQSSKGEVISAPAASGLDAGDLVIFTNFSILLEDLEELTGDKDARLVRYEEVYLRFKKRCT
jgi:hypothetical protein